LCGFTILLERNVKVGDYIELESNYFGKVIGVNVQNTVLRTFDGIDVLVPNSRIVGEQVVNWTRRDPHMRLHIPFGVAYGTDQDKIKEVVCNTALSLSPTLSQEKGFANPDVWLLNFGDSSLDFELVVWVNIIRSGGRRRLRSIYLSAIEKAFKEHHIRIPFPQRDVHFPDSQIEKIQISPVHKAGEKTESDV